jgi:hypothetical protein
MAKSNLKVYLDHHIRRDNLLYKQSVKDVDTTEETIERFRHLTIRDLYGEKSKARLLRKPDFQRATWAWTPKDCVDLLESVLQEQVVPSVIMWLSPDSEWYVLDGGHRISVLLAWIRDNWGDRVSSAEYNDPTLERNSKEAAQYVREMLAERKIGSFEEYLIAEQRYTQLLEERRSPESQLDSTSIEYAKLVRRWDSVNIGFPILWVKGGYDKAEDSFLKINKSGRQLSPWETKLVENRSSSFARVVMSIAQVRSAEHCWPTRDSEVENDEILKQRVGAILKKVNEIHELLFTPPYKLPVDDPRQPLMVTPSTRPEMKPAYLAELLTITEGKKGQKAETEALIKRDMSDRVSHIVTNGLRLVDDATDVLNNIYGPSPRSLLLMPLVYFYNKQGTHVRSLLYGMIYWLNHGTENRDVFNRKLLFSAHRAKFEEVLLKNKDVIIRRITRKIGSGPEVTLQTARYFNGLLELLIKHNDDIETSDFREDHKRLVATLGKGKLASDVDEQEIAIDEEERESSSPTFRGTQRIEIQVQNFIEKFNICGVCDGRYYPGLFTQVDHIQPRAKGGKTVVSNARETHPFCNNNREAIEAIRAGSQHVEIPAFDLIATRTEQLKFLFFLPEDEIAEEIGEEEVTDGEIAEEES